MPELSPKQQLEQRVRELAEPLVMAEGMELVDLEYLREREGWVLRLFIDKPGGVGLDDCSVISRAVGASLDVEDLIPQEYHLEVSSPGLSRPLTKPVHFEKAQGKKVKVKTYGPLGEPPRRNFVGVLLAVSPDGISVDVEGAGSFHIAFKDIAKANLEFQP